jgi:3-hydroxy-9,10-secoandrosta-1,3,5(10)-triene-9,17-dione monooxygenase reductase component
MVSRSRRRQLDDRPRPRRAPSLTPGTPSLYSVGTMFDAKELRRVMGMFATGVTVLTTRDARGAPYGLTANAVTSLSLDPPLLIICVDKRAETHPHFFDSRCFVVNILAEDQAELSTRFARSGGDKFAGLSFSVNQDGVPVLDGTLAHVECRIVETHEGGDHVIHIGEVHHAEVREGGRPLLFFCGKYCCLQAG